MLLYSTECPVVARLLRSVSLGALVFGMLTSGTVARAASPLSPGSVVRSNGTMYVIGDPNAPAPTPIASYAPAQAPAAQSSSVPVSSNVSPMTLTTSPLYLHGSNPIVMEAGTKAYNIFWQPQNPSTWSIYNSDMNRFFSDIGSTGYYGNLTQYYDNYIHIQNHSELDGNWQDTQFYPTSTVYSTNIANEVQHAITTNGWPIDSTKQYNVFLGTNSTGGPEVLCTGSSSSSPGSCTNNSYVCAYHSFTNMWNPAIGQYVTVAYTANPYGLGYNNSCKPPVTMCPNGSGCNVDSALQWLSHETFETTSDAFPSGSLTAWQDQSGQEIGDKCQTAPYTGVVNSSYNHTFNGHNYILQDEWNNAYTAGGTGGNCTPYGPTYP